MARDKLRLRTSPPDVLGFADDLLAVPRHFLAGLIVGVLGPLVSLVGIVGAIYLFTRRIPLFTQIDEETGDRRLILELVEPDEARALAERSKEAAKAFGDEIRSEFEGEQL